MTDTITIPAGELWRHVGWEFDFYGVPHIIEFVHHGDGRIYFGAKGEFLEGGWKAHISPTDIVTLRKPEVPPCR